MITFVLFALSVGMTPSLSYAFAKIRTVPQVDLTKYVGVWYDIASNPVIFQPNCACERQVLSPTDNGRVLVFNSCNKPDGVLTEIRGTARPVNRSGSKLSVDFGFLFKGDYWIIALDPEYRYAVVTDRFGYSLYILSRTPELEDSLYQEALRAAESQVSISRLKASDQAGCHYPPE